MGTVATQFGGRLGTGEARNKRVLEWTKSWNLLNKMLRLRVKWPLAQHFGAPEPTRFESGAA